MNVNCPNCGAYIAPYNVITRQKYINKPSEVISHQYHCKELLDDDSVCDCQFETDKDGVFL